jgi:xylan 1,4-beta-xylosidase
VTLVTLDPVRDETPPWLDDSRILGRTPNDSRTPNDKDDA